MNGYALASDGDGLREFVVREFVEAPLGEEDVRVRVEFSCVEHEEAHADICPGSALVGTVVETGSAASGFQGARVLVPAVVACGECDTCRSGAATVCPNRAVLGRDRHGGLAELVVCSGRWLTRSDELLPLSGATAALAAGPLLRAYGLYCRAGVRAGDVVLLFGAGPVAALLGTLATSRGSKVIRVDEAMEEAQLGEALAAQTAGGKPQKLFVCDGPSNLARAVALAHPNSIVTTAVAGTGVDVALAFEKELTLLNASQGHPDLLPEAAALVVKGEIDLGTILSEGQAGNSTLADAAGAHANGKCLVVAGLSPEAS